MQTPGPNCKYLAFLFPLSWLQSAHTDEAEELYINPLADGIIRVQNCLTTDISSHAAEMLSDVVYLYSGTAAGAWLGIKARILQFYSLLFREGLVDQSPGRTMQSNILMAISQYIHENFSYPITLEILGREFHMSPKYFSAYFQKHFYRGFSDYLTAVRLENAKILLQETDFSIEHISQMSGFSAGSYFIRTFKKHQGLTPAQYRRLMLSSKQANIK